MFLKSRKEGKKRIREGFFNSNSAPRDVCLYAAFVPDKLHLTFTYSSHQNIAKSQQKEDKLIRSFKSIHIIQKVSQEMMSSFDQISECTETSLRHEPGNQFSLFKLPIKRRQGELKHLLKTHHYHILYILFRGKS